MDPPHRPDLSTAHQPLTARTASPATRSRLESERARAGPPIRGQPRIVPAVPAGGGASPPVEHDCRPHDVKGDTRGLRRDHRNPQGQSEQVRGGPPFGPDQARPDAVHRDPVPGRLRLHRRHPRPGRRPAGRAGAAGRGDVPGLPGHRPGDRHVPDDGRGRSATTRCCACRRTTRGRRTCRTSAT